MLLPPPSPASSAIVARAKYATDAPRLVPRSWRSLAAPASHRDRSQPAFGTSSPTQMVDQADVLAAAAALAEAQITSAETAAQQAASAAARTRRAKESTSSWGAAIDGFAMSLAHASGDTLRSFAEGLMPTPADAGAASESEEEEEESSPEPKPWGWEFRVTLPGGASQPDAPDEPEAAAAAEPPTPPASPAPLSPPSPAAAETEPSPPTTPPRTPPSRRAFTVLGRSPRADDPASAGPTLLSLGNFQLQLGAPSPPTTSSRPSRRPPPTGESPSPRRPRRAPTSLRPRPSRRRSGRGGPSAPSATWRGCARRRRGPTSPAHRAASSGRRSSRSAVSASASSSIRLRSRRSRPRRRRRSKRSRRWTCAPSSRCCASAGWARPGASRRPTSCNEQRRRCTHPNVRP